MPSFISLIALCLERSLSRFETGSRSHALPRRGRWQVPCQLFFADRDLSGQWAFTAADRASFSPSYHFLTHRSGAASAPSILLKTREIGARLPRSRSATTCVNHSFCPAICLVKMVPRCEPPHFDTESRQGLPMVAVSSLAKLFFTNYTLSSHGAILGSGWQTPSESIRRKGLSAEAGRAICLPNLFHQPHFVWNGASLALRP